VLSSTGAGPNLLRLPNGAEHRGFRQILGFKKLHEIRTVVGTGNFTGSWSPHSVQQRMSEGRERKDKMGGDDCAEQSVTNSATCRARVIPASVALTPPQFFVTHFHVQ